MVLYSIYYALAFYSIQILMFFFYSKANAVLFEFRVITNGVCLIYLNYFDDILVLLLDMLLEVGFICSRLNIYLYYV